MAVSVYLGIDWDKDGNYTDESSRLKIDSLVIRRGRANILDSNGFVPMSPADVWAELRNYDNRYDPFNSGSAIYPNVLPGRPTRVTVTSGVTTHHLFNGWTTDLRALGAERKNAYLRASDGLQFLNMQFGETRADADETVAVALGVLVTQSDWPVSAGSNIEDNGDSITVWHPDVLQTLYEEMQEMAEAFAGTIFINAEGGFEYRVRDSSAATVLELTEDEIQREFETASPWDEIYNDVRTEGRAYSASLTNSTSITNYGRRTMAVGRGVNDYIQSTANATSLATHMLAYSNIAKRPLKIKLTNRFTEQFSLDLMDRVQVTIADYGIDALYIVGYIEHRFLTRGNCVTTMYLEPYYYSVVSNMYPLTFPFTLGW